MTIIEPLHSRSDESIQRNIDFNEKELIITVLMDNAGKMSISHSDLKEMSISPLVGGSLNLNYRVIIKNRSFFVKHQIKSSVTYKNSIIREYEVLTHLYWEKKALYVPKPLVFDDANKILITDYIPGHKPILKRDSAKELTRCMKTVMKDLKEVDVNFLKHICTNTRTSPHLFWKEYAKPRLRLLQKEAIICEIGSVDFCNVLYQVERAIDSRLEEQDENEYVFDWDDEKPWWFSLIHNDLALRNMLQISSFRTTASSVSSPFFIIDWEFADAGSIAYDLAFFAAEHQTSVDYVLNFLPSGFSHQELMKVKTLIITFMPLIDLINAWSILSKLKEYKAMQDQWLSTSSLADGATYFFSSKPPLLTTMPYTIDQGLYYSLRRLRRLNQQLGLKYDSTRIFHEAQAILNYFKTKVALY